MGIEHGHPGVGVRVGGLRAVVGRIGCARFLRWLTVGRRRLRLQVLLVEVVVAHDVSILLRRTGLPPSTASVLHILVTLRQYVNTLSV